MDEKSAPRVLLSWVGSRDLAVAEGRAEGGPLAQVVDAAQPDRVVLLSDWRADRSERLRDWLQARTKAEVSLRAARLTSPTHHDGILSAVDACLQELARREPAARRVFNLSSGTPAMAVAWAVLGSTAWTAELWESSAEEGARRVELPYRLSLQTALDLVAASDDRIVAMAGGQGQLPTGFRDLVAEDPATRTLVERAARAARRDVPVLLLGPTGSGKEVIARGIHAASRRHTGPFIALNCGAIPSELIESELFGSRRGAYSGATEDRKGFIESAHGGTLFLDEVAELPAAAQVKLLRALQEREVQPVGARSPIPVDFRLVAATHRVLPAAGFRDDLYYRIAVAVLHLPSLARRPLDIEPLARRFLAELDPDLRLTADGIRALRSHSWPGNVRELQNVLARVATWSEGVEVDAEQIRLALELRPAGADGLTERPLGGGFQLDVLIDDVRSHYMRRALEQAAGNLTRAADLLGLENRQKLTYWVDKLGLR